MIILLILNVVIIERILFMPDIILKTKDLTKKYQVYTYALTFNNTKTRSIINDMATIFFHFHFLQFKNQK